MKYRLIDAGDTCDLTIHYRFTTDHQLFITPKHRRAIGGLVADYIKSHCKSNLLVAHIEDLKYEKCD